MDRLEERRDLRSFAPPPRHSRAIRITVRLVAAASALCFAAACGPSDSIDARPVEQARSGHTSPGSCNGTIGPVSVDHVDVPDGATCRLDGTHVDGNVSVGMGATLVARGIHVDGDVESEGSSAVEISASARIGGNVQLQQGRSAAIIQTRIDGDLTWEEQQGNLVAQRTTVGGNLQADGNSGHIDLSGNTVNGDLSCEDNRLPPTGHDNTVAGDKEDQCRGL